MSIRKGLPAKLALTDADDTRYDFNNLVVSLADGTPRGGIIAPVGSAIVSGTATMALSIAAFAAVAVRDKGSILLASDGVDTSVLIATAPASNSRIDLVCARQDDASSTVSTPDADNDPSLYVVQGTAAPTPTKPTLPDGSVELGSVTVAAGNTATNQMSFTPGRYTAGAGGIVPFRTLSLLQSWTTARTGQYADVMADTTSNNGLYRWNGSSWYQVTNDTGWITMSGFAASFTAGTYPPQYRLLNGVVYLRGEFFRAAAPTGRVAAYTLPTGFQPPSWIWFPFGAFSFAADIQISPAGVISIQSNSARTGSPGYTLTGLSFPVA